MIKQSQKNLETFFKAISSAIENKIKTQLDDACPDVACPFTTFTEVEMAGELNQNQDAMLKFDFIANDKNYTSIMLVPEIIIAKISDLLTGGDGKNVDYRGELTEIELNSIREIVVSSLDEISNHFSLKYEADVIFGTDYTVYLKEMPEYEGILSDCDLTFCALTNFVLEDPEEKHEVRLLLNNNFVTNFMSELGFSEDSIKEIRNNVDIEQLSDVKINITAEFGHTQLPIKCALELTKNSLICLDEFCNEDVKVYANGLLVAYAQIVAIEENFGLRLTRIIPPEERLNMKQ